MATLIDDLDVLLDTPAEAAALAPAASGKKLYIESYGCQMNFSDSEIVMAILAENGYTATTNDLDADVVLLNTCAIRDNAEQKIRARLQVLNKRKRKSPDLVVGVLGCMAERLKTKLLDEERAVDLVVGPDAYRSLPELLDRVETGQKAVNVFLSREETYADIEPVRLGGNGVSAYISIMRGCDNMCSFCVVPYTRGRERSRDLSSIVAEAQDLFDKGYREVTLLGQNVDSYKWEAPAPAPPLQGGELRSVLELHKESESFFPPPSRGGVGEGAVRFAGLLAAVAAVSPLLRVRFSTSHPKDMTDEVLHVMAAHPNICNYIHLPAQSGNSRVLELMNRTYDRAWYLDRIAAIRRIIGEDCGISTDIIAGFCSETEAEHAETLSLMEAVQYDMAYMFAYSERPGTPAAKKLVDDIPEDVKKRRLQEIIALQGRHSLERNQRHIGKVARVLIEGPARRGEGKLCGRNDQNCMVVFPAVGDLKKGDYADVLIESCSQATLLGTIV